MISLELTNVYLQCFQAASSTCSTKTKTISKHSSIKMTTKPVFVSDPKPSFPRPVSNTDSLDGFSRNTSELRDASDDISERSEVRRLTESILEQLYWRVDLFDDFCASVLDPSFFWWNQQLVQIYRSHSSAQLSKSFVILKNKVWITITINIGSICQNIFFEIVNYFLRFFVANLKI